MSDKPQTGPAEGTPGQEHSALRTPHSALESLQRLSNAEARPIAEALYTELAKQYHPSALLKIVGLLDRIRARETKNQQVAHQLKITN